MNIRPVALNFGQHKTGNIQKKATIQPPEEDEESDALKELLDSIGGKMEEARGARIHVPYRANSFITIIQDQGKQAYDIFYDAVEKGTAQSLHWLVSASGKILKGSETPEKLMNYLEIADVRLDEGTLSVMTPQ